jgi:Bacterial extracellular solute-binding protein.
MKKLRWLLSLVLVVLLLAACGGNDKSSGKKSGDEGSKEEKTTLSLAVWGSSTAETEGLEKTVKSFEEKTGIKVNIEVITDNFQDQITARFAANNPPDVFYLEAYTAPKFIDSGVLLDITNDVPDQDDFYQPLLDAFKDSEGHLYAVPKDYSTLATYVNVDLLEQAGYTIDDVPADWEELNKFAEELQSKLPDGVCAMIFDRSLARHMAALKAHGLDVETKDGKADFTSSEGAIKYLESLVEGRKKGYDLNPSMDLGMDSAAAAFGSEKTVIMIEGNWVLSALKNEYPDVNYAILPAPKVNGKEETMIYTVGYAIAKDSKNKDAAIKFINYMTGEGQQMWSELSGTFPTRQSVAEAMKLKENEELKAHIEGASYGTPWRSGINLPTISTAFDNNFQAALNGDMSVLEAMKAAEKEANDEIARQE